MSTAADTLSRILDRNARQFTFRDDSLRYGIDGPEFSAADMLDLMSSGEFPIEKAIAISVKSLMDTYAFALQRKIGPDVV